MNKKIISVIAVLLCLAIPMPAKGLKVAPVVYNVQLQSGNNKKGFIDITNTESVKTKYTFTVQAFKQINAEGGLQFYDNDMMKAGVLLDYSEYEIEPRQTLRLAFIADGSKLPSGDSFAAIFAAASSTDAPGAPSARVGTILIIQNGTPAEHKAQITALDVPFWQIGDNIKGSYKIKNTSDPNKSAGFMPAVDITIDPLHQSVRNQSSLVFAGIERQNDFAVQTNRFGFYKVTVAFGDSKAEKWVFFATPLGLATFIAIAGAVAVLTVALVHYLRSPKRVVRRNAKRHVPKRD